MSKSNFERMLQLADEVFAVKNDTDQIDVNQEVLERLMRIHPAAVQNMMMAMGLWHGSN